jgi:hypothetical protein
MSRFVHSLSLLLLAGYMVQLASVAQAQSAPPCPITADSNVTTGHNDTCRTGWQQNETILTPSTVSQSTFGLLWQYSVNGAVFAQPLAYHASVTIGSNGHTCSNCDVVFIADEQDNVYAFEADPSSQQLLWSDTLNSNGDYLTCDPNEPLPCGAGVIGPDMGITSTPVIDEVNKIIYVVSLENVFNNNGYYPQYFLTAINLLTGAQLASEQISASVAGVSPGSTATCTLATGTGTVYFVGGEAIQRAGLLLLGNTALGTYGTVYISFAPASNEWTNGWMMGYQYSSGSLTQAYVLNTTPYGSGGGMWEGGDGLVAADATVSGTTSTYIFAPTGNGTFDWNTPKNNYGDTLLRLTTGLSISDFFTPADELTYSGSMGTGRCVNDEDLDSGGLIALPDETPAFFTGHPHLMVAADKEAVLYVVDRDNLTQHHTPTDLIVQWIQTPTICTLCNVWGYWGYPAYWRWTDAHGTHRALYYSVRELDIHKAPLAINQYTLIPTGPIPSSYASTTDLFCNYGAVPSVSSNGSTGGILWAIEATNSGNPDSCPVGTVEPGTDYLDIALHAYDATNIGNPTLYNGRSHNSSPFHTGYPIKFTTPTIFNGKVLAGARNETNTGGTVDVWGLCSENPSRTCLE